MGWLFSIAVHNAVLVVLLALPVWCIARLCRRPPVAHLLWSLLLIKLITPPAFHLTLFDGAGEPAKPIAETASTTSAGSRSSIPVADGQPEPLSAKVISSGERSDDGPASANTALPELSGTSSANGTIWVSALPAWRSVRPLLIGFWIAGSVLTALLAGARIVRFHRLVGGMLPAPTEVQSVADELAMHMGLPRTPSIRMAAVSVSPLVWWLGGRATIVIPRELLSVLDERQTALVLAHELAHLRRRDHWIRCLELAISILYWWHPLIWWARRQMHAAEEQSCDAWVAWVFPERTREYARSLLTAAELLSVRPACGALASPFLSPSTLKDRIELLLARCTPHRVSRAWGLSLGLLAAMLIPLGVRGATDRQPEPPEGASSPVDRQLKALDQPSKDGNAPVPQVVEKAEPRPDFQLFQGTFRVENCSSDKWNAPKQETEKWQWAIRDREIVWTRPGHDDLKLSMKLDPTTVPAQIDLTILNGPDQGKTCQGVYILSRHWIAICFQNPGEQVARPENFTSTPDREYTSVTLFPTRVFTPAEEAEALQGEWKFDMYYSDWWPERISDPPVRWSRWRWTVSGNEILWTGMKVDDVTLSFTLDPSQSPRQIDLTFRDGPHQGKVLRGAYKFDSIDGFSICFADPEAKVDRPVNVSYSTDAGRTMAVLEKAAAQNPVAGEASASAENRTAEIDGAINRLRKIGAFVREFHPRGDSRYWVQVISTGMGSDTRQSAPEFDDSALQDVELIARGSALHLHLRETSVSPAGLQRLETAGRIDMLELSGNNVDDDIVKVLPRLPLRGELALQSDSLTNRGVEVVSRCRDLTGISLHGKRLADHCLEKLTSLPSLKSVNLGPSFTRHAFDILSQVQGLASLEVSELTADLNDLKKLPKLKRLILSGRRYDDEAARMIAETFQTLEEAYLRETSITNEGAAHLSQIKTLRVLTLDGAAIDDGIAHTIREMKQLTWFSARDCNVGDETAVALSECPGMWYLFLANTQVSDEGIAHLVKLNKPLSLYLIGCEAVTDACLRSLAKLPDSAGLHVNLQHSGVTLEGARELQAALPHAQIIWGVPQVPLR